MAGGRRIRRVMAFAALAVVACGGDSGGPDGTEDTATMRLMHTASGMAALDLLVGGQLVAGNVPYEHASAAVSVPGGSQTLVVRRAGEQSVLGSKQTTLTPGKTYTLVVSGTSTGLVLTPSVVVDTGLARSDRANLRIINISTVVFPTDSSQAPPPVPLDVYITPPGIALGGAGSQLSLDARVSSYSSLMYFDPGSLVVRFVTAGTLSVVAETPPIAIAAGEVRAVTLQRNPDGTWKTTVVIEE